MRRRKLIDSRLICRAVAGVALVAASMPGGVAFAAEDTCLGATQEVRVAAVPDARSLALHDGRVIRIAGIEPFDLYAPNAEAAEPQLRERLQQLVGRQIEATLTSDRPDRYGRYPALLLADGAFLQETITGNGLTVAFAGGDALPCFGRILAAEDDARRAGRGFWSGRTLPPANPDVLTDRVGAFTIFEGKILSVGNRGARTYLDFGKRWSEDVTVEIEARDRKHFGGETGLAALAGGTVRVRGFLQAKSGPMMIVGSPMQLEVLRPAPRETGTAP